MHQVANPIRSEMVTGHLMGGRKMVAMVAKRPKNNIKTAIKIPHFESLPEVEFRISNDFLKVQAII